jgi:hypothetical protein
MGEGMFSWVEINFTDSEHNQDFSHRSRYFIAAPRESTLSYCTPSLQSELQLGRLPYFLSHVTLRSLLLGGLILHFGTRGHL